VANGRRMACGLCYDVGIAGIRIRACPRKLNALDLENLRQSLTIIVSSKRRLVRPRLLMAAWKP
jgi:hypothetical protein